MPEKNLSFIPKKNFNPIVYKNAGAGLFLSASFFLLILSGVLYGGLYFYKYSINKEIFTLNDSLNKVKSAFELSTIDRIVAVSSEIDTAKNILGQHKTAIPVFDFLQKDTVKDLRFKIFRLSFDEDGAATVSIDGTAKSFLAIAVQEDVFKNESTVSNVLFSDFKLGDKGTVDFKTNLMFYPSTFVYKSE
ncbi:MAG: Uncharacterized protein Athens071424_214 [Parcubacteria group bacterium Athens0714_24]|nr:MAG: Uncharacterized protein Athens071424_214 [Parcubacteria group bacterium Athens0714_24]